jgi:hypothetical protein
MRKLFKKVFVVMLILLPPALAACAANKTDSGPSGQVEKPVGSYLPLQVGNRWEYAGSGNEYASYKQYVTFQKGNSYQVMVDNGGTIAASRIEVDADRIVRTYREGEVYDNRNILDQPANDNTLLLKMPVKAGTTWTSGEAAYKIARTDARVEVPAGVFDNCVLVEATYQESKSQSLSYFKEGVGLVKTEFVTEGGDKITSDLEEYTVTAKPANNVQ